MNSKRIVAGMLAAMLLALLLPFGVLASETEETTWRDFDFSGSSDDPVNEAGTHQSGTCGEGISWRLDADTLTISGCGEMADGCPWAPYKDRIRKVILTGGVTRIGEGAFSECDRIIQINFGDALVEIGTEAFYACTGLTKLHMPASFRRFGPKAFVECSGLSIIYCDGPMPSFKDSCLWTGSSISVYYPPNNPWPEDEVARLTANFGGRLTICAGSLDVLGEEEPIVAASVDTPATEAVTEPVTEATEAPAAEPVTVPVTEPATEPTTVPTTEETTEATVAETTEEPTFAPAETVYHRPQEPLPPRDVGGDGWIGIVIVAAVLTLILVGALIIRGASHKGGRYS